MEMNTRIQVQHPITEETTKLDLVTWQIRIAAGHQLTIDPKQLEPVGHAIECRITGEDPTNDFAPSIGTVETFVAPGGPGVRVDSHLYSGYRVPPNYDSLLAKIITWGRTREEAITRMDRALAETVITGIAHTAPFQRAVMADPAFQRGDVHTGFVPQLVERLGPLLEDDEFESHLQDAVTAHAAGAAS
jgi:acetyl-CoA carboxylase biotin carboxylase subunit